MQGEQIQDGSED